MAPGPQLYSGTTAVYDNDSNIVGYIGSYYSASGYFREVIVALKDAIAAPVKIDDHALSGSSTTYQTPQHAESAFKQNLGVSDNTQLDRWWITTSAVSSPQSYPNPATGYSLHEVAGTYASGTQDVTELWARFTKPAQGRTDAFLMIASLPNAGPAVAPEDSDFFALPNENPSTGSAFDSIVQSHMSSYERWTAQEAIKKYSSTQSYPSSW